MIAEPTKRHGGRGREAVQLMMAYAHRFLVATLISSVLHGNEGHLCRECSLCVFRTFVASEGEYSVIFAEQGVLQNMSGS